MKPLTIDELKKLNVGDWIYFCNSTDDGYYVIISSKVGGYILIEGLPKVFELSYSEYGTKWVAYKNKEQAEETECIEVKRKGV